MCETVFRLSLCLKSYPEDYSIVGITSSAVLVKVLMLWGLWKCFAAAGVGAMGSWALTDDRRTYSGSVRIHAFILKEMQGFVEPWQKRLNTEMCQSEGQLCQQLRIGQRLLWDETWCDGGQRYTTVSYQLLQGIYQRTQTAHKPFLLLPLWA